MQKRLCLMFALLSAMVLGAWADGVSSFGGGDGSAKYPYLIKTAAQWNQFASNVNGGTSYSGMYFLLDDDISVTTMVGAGTTGKNAKPFSGTFDGGGHTLTFTHTATEEEGDIAPFRFIRNATICNLHVAGEITTAYKHAGGLAGRTYGTSLIQNCRVSTVIKSSKAGDATHGGIVAMKPDWSSAHLTIDGCVYDGMILTTNGSTDCAGFVGYTSYGSLTIRNSIYAPPAPEENETAVSSDKTFYRYNASHEGTITMDKCYYTQTIGSDDSQGKQTLSIGFPAEVDITVVPTGNATEYSVSGITVYEGNPCMKYDGTVYAGSGDEVELTFTHNYVGCNVTNYRLNKDSDAKLTGDLTNGYTLKMGSANVVFDFAMTGPALYFLEGSGTSASPYIISSAGVWDYIVSLVNYGEKYVSGTDDQNNNIYSEYASAYYKLTDDITVETMMGSENHRFKGHIDGDGKTLTLSYGSEQTPFNEDYCAPFRYIEGAEISNLIVDGTIYTQKQFAAGFVANAQGDNTMTNCRSSVTINSSVNGDGSHGGFVAHNLSGTFSMAGCAFDGQMLGSSTNNCGGFVGWNETNGSTEGVVVFRNCFFAPTSITVELEHTYARSRTNDGAHVQMYYSSCQTSIGDNQQFRAYSISGNDGVTVATTQSAVNTYAVSGIKIYEVGMKYNGVLYAREGQTMSLNLGYASSIPEGGNFGGFSTTTGTLTYDGSSYTLTMGKGDAIINAVINGDETAWTHGGNGTLESPYIISTNTEWNEFANKVNNGAIGFAIAYYQLTANITVTTMVGTEGYKFKGHFDGDGKTLTLSYGSEQTPFNEDYCAPFRYIEGAEISNLIVDGTIYTQKQFAAGIAGYALNNNAITDCRSSVTINSSVRGDGTHGGFVANCQNNADGETYVTFTRCAFDGKLLGATTDNCGGFVGWTAGNDWAGVTFSNCIFAPRELSVQSDGSATFSRGQSYYKDYFTVNNSYYIQRLGAMQGEMAYTEQPTDVTAEAMTIAGITVYVKKTMVNNLAASGITPTTATVSWMGTEACSNYQVRYRIKQNASYSTSFDDGLPDGWTTFDNDDDEHNWTYEDGTKKGMAHSGNGSMYSASYINNYGAMEPDNWLVSPQLDLGGTMKVWLKGQDGDDFREHFAIYLSTTGSSKSDFVDESGNLQSGVVTLVPETETTNVYQEFTAKLSTYKGQKGYIAIRHFNCYDQFYLVLDDFSVSNADEGEWTTVSSASPAGTTLTGLDDDTAYEYQIGFDYGGKTFYTPTATLSTLSADVAPIDLTANSNSASTATISWKGFGDTYNLRYYQGGLAKVTLSVPNDVWGDGSGYQMLIDQDHDTYGDVIPATGGLTGSGPATSGEYDNFEHKIPENADGSLETGNVVNGTTVTELTIEIPAGIYDWCITNPSPDDRVWIASGNGNVGGRQNDFTFEAGKHYTFTVTFDDGSSNDCVNMTVEDDIDLAQGDMIEITGITGTSYTLSELTASTHYAVFVQSVKGERTSNWSSVNFNTLANGELYLYDNQDNSTIIAANSGEQFNVTLQGRTLYKDGDWNTLCLPFALTDTDTDTSHSLSDGGRDRVTFTGTILEGAEVMGFDHASFDASTGTLDITFGKDYQVYAGVPFIIRWTKADGYDEADPKTRDIKNPVFNSVKITAVEAQTEDPEGYAAAFVGTYSPIVWETENRSILFLGEENTLYFPLPSGGKIPHLNAFRAYFRLNGLTAGDVASARLYFDEDTQNGIGHTEITEITEKADASWYTIDGVRLNGQPTKKGLYIYKGKKVKR